VNQRAVDRFEQTRQRAPVSLKPTETPQQERERRVRDLHGILNQVATANPPLSEDGISQLLGSKGDNKYDIVGSQLDATTRQGLFDLMRGIHQLGRARLAIAEGNHDVAKGMLDMDPADQHPGVTHYRDAALKKGLTYEELAPLSRASIAVAQGAYGALSTEQEALNQEAGKLLARGKEVTAYFEGKGEVMSQGPIVQTTLEQVRKYSKELERALAMPLTDGNRATEVKAAKEKLDANLKDLGPNALNDLEKGRRGTIDGLNNGADIISAIPTPPTRVAGLITRTVANGLEYASGDINGKQFALKQTAAIIDAAGGQITQRLGNVAKSLADAGFEFQKSLASELAKIDPKLPESEQERLGKIAIRTALHNAVTGIYSDAIGNSFGEPGQRFIKELARASSTGLAGVVATGANEINKTLYDKSLTPEQKSLMIREALWKGVTNVVKTATESVLAAIRR
jgi:hypothetical protein